MLYMVGASAFISCFPPSSLHSQLPQGLCTGGSAPWKAPPPGVPCSLPQRLRGLAPTFHGGHLLAKASPGYLIENHSSRTPTPSTVNPSPCFSFFLFTFKMTTEFFKRILSAICCLSFCAKA